MQKEWDATYGYAPVSFWKFSAKIFKNFQKNLEIFFKILNFFFEILKKFEIFWKFWQFFSKFWMDYQAGLIGQPGWLIWSSGDLGSVASCPLSQTASTDTYTSGPKNVPNLCTNLWGFRKAGERRYGSEGGIIMVESGVLGESNTPSGDLLGYRDS